MTIPFAKANRKRVEEKNILKGPKGKPTLVCYSSSTSGSALLLLSLLSAMPIMISYLHRVSHPTLFFGISVKETRTRVRTDKVLEELGKVMKKATSYKERWWLKLKSGFTF